MGEKNAFERKPMFSNDDSHLSVPFLHYFVCDTASKRERCAGS